MTKEDIKTVVIFGILILSISGLLLFDYIKNNKNNNVDRKIVVINNINYNDVLKSGTELFFNVIDLLINDELNYEKNDSNKIKEFDIDGNKYYKITNFNIVYNKLKKSEVEKFMKYKNIILRKGSYYINYVPVSTNYIGSIIEISDYSENYVIFKNNNYYCSNYKYIGNIDDNLNCNYEKKESTFKIVFSNDNLVINNIDELINIIEK